MEHLPPPLAGLNEYPQFICWRTETVDGALKKYPCNHLGEVIDAQDPRYWMTFETAAHYAAQTPGLNVGYVFTDQDPYFFVDLDACADGGQWSALAQSVLALFPGAAVEVSQSGNGLHIIGRGVSPPHSMRNAEFGLEFYTEKRFIALTGSGVVGDCNTEHTAALAQFAPYYFPPRPEFDAADWTDGPHALSRPLKTDDALIKKALASTSAAAGFGLRASFRDLWEANAEKLAEIWPPQNANDTFDRSYADIALCQHLAFWTGGDCERIEKLFSKSALVRGKWEDREEYRRGTILLAVSRCTDFYGSAQALKEAATQSWSGNTEDELNTETTLCCPQIVPYETQAEFFKGHVLLTGAARILCPDGEIRGQHEFNTVYGGREFAAPFGGRPITKAWDAFNSPNLKRAEVFDVCYRPEYDFGKIIVDDNRRFVNNHVRSDGPRAEGNATPFTDHVKTLLPHGRDAEILLSWLAAFIQYPGKKFMWAPLIQGVEGNGKSIISEILIRAIGRRHHTDVDPEDLCASGGKFNVWIRGHRLATIEELKTGSRTKAENTLKRLIANKHIQIQGKGENQTTERSVINFYITSNHQDAILVTDSTRRIAPLFTAQQNRGDLDAASMGRGGTYFSNFFDWLDNKNGWAICANFLDTYDIPAEFNPAEGCDKAPETTALRAAVEACTPVATQTIEEAIKLEEIGFRGGMVGTKYAERLLSEKHKWAGPQKLTALLLSIGLHPAPALVDCNGKISIGNERQRIFTRIGCLADQAKTADALREMWVRVNTAERVAAGDRAILR